MTKFFSRLEKMKPSGGGGCHQDLLGVSNLAKRSGVEYERAFALIRRHVPDGRRPVGDQEIYDALDKAYFGPHCIAKEPRPAFDRQAYGKLLANGEAIDEDWLKAGSRYPIPLDPREQSRLFIETMFRPKELIVDGDRYAVTARRVEERLRQRESGVGLGPFICINPLSGEVSRTASGHMSNRCDAFVSRHAIALGEFDCYPDTGKPIPKIEQIKFWGGINMRIAALIDSGGKSIHAWIPVNCANSEEWTQIVRIGLFQNLLIPLGVDAACQNPSRLSRLPGVKRGTEWQRLLYLAGPEGGQPCQE